MRKIVLLIISLVFFCGTALSQNLDNIGESFKKPLKVNGGLSMGTIVYGGNDASVDRQAFTWFVNGNINEIGRAHV
jgi:hypothetical protein